MAYNPPPPRSFEVFTAVLNAALPPLPPDGSLAPDVAVEDAPPEGCTPGNPGYPDNNPKTAFGVKKLPLHLVPPSAIAHLARAFSDGARKYGPYNWRDHAISSSVYYGAAMRHLTAWWDGEDINPDSGHLHLAHAMACLAMILDGDSVGKLNDDRPPWGAMPDMQGEWNQENGGNV
jgi:Domain of unknown function (DUF5664)